MEKQIAETSRAAAELHDVDRMLKIEGREGRARKDSRAGAVAQPTEDDSGIGVDDPRIAGDVLGNDALAPRPGSLLLEEAPLQIPEERGGKALSGLQDAERSRRELVVR